MADVSYIISLRDRVSRVANRIQQSFRAVQNQVDQLDNALTALGGIAGGAALSGIFQLGAELQKTQLFFNTLTGSVERGTQLFGELTEFANATPFSNQALNQNAQTLLAFGQDADTVTNTLRMLGDVAGGDQERLGRLTLAFSQIQSTGRLMGQDLLQLINAGFNPLNEISEATGISMRELKDQMRLGNISANLITKAFQRATGPGGRFHNLTNQMSTTLAGRWSTAVGKGRFLVSQFGLALEGIFAPFLEGAIRAFEFMDRFRNIIFPVVAGLGAMIAIIGGVIIAVKLWTAAQWLLNIALNANPIGIVILAIGALVTAFTVAYQNSERFRRVVHGVWAALKEIGNILVEFISPQIKAFTLFVRAARRIFLDFVDTIRLEVVDALRRLVLWFAEVEKQILDLYRSIFDFFGVDFEKVIGDSARVGQGVIDRLKELGKRVAKAYNEGLNEEIQRTAEVVGEAPTSQLDFGINSELKKLQAEGIVSGGGIRTFNININSLTGVGTLSTTNLDSGSQDVGEAIQEAILRALADIRNIG